MTKKSYGEFVRDRRINSETTLRDASKSTGIAASRLSQIETHLGTHPTPEEHFALEKLLGIGPGRERADFEDLLLDYKQDLEGLGKQNVILGALRAGTSPEEMAARFGVIVCKASEDDVADFQDLCEEACHDKT